MVTLGIQVMLVLLGVACAGLGWSIADAVVRRRSARPTSD
jgi:hypothetical protein